MPGPVGSNSKDPVNSIYVVRSNDPVFGDSWQNYKKAVMLGAAFYDGNKDGKYEPKDLDGDGKWDLTEDKPDVAGDITAWCVYNDGVPKAQRLFSDMNPIGIEIHQMIFAHRNTDIIFIRYRITNKGTVNERLDSVIFSIWTDYDIGDYIDDLIGCDTLLNLGYTYNSGSDGEFAINPPASGVVLLQGPPVFVPGLTYIDLNSDKRYDDSIDIAIDTAIQKNGFLLKPLFIPGAKNQSMTSFSWPYFGGGHEPNFTKFSLRCVQKGLRHLCTKINVCDWPYGLVHGGIGCNQVNPIYHYSGDPVSNTGWINTLVTDQRSLLSTGEFTLSKNIPVDIWIAYVVGRGVDSLDSVTKMKWNAGFVKAYYEDWYMVIPDEAQPIKLPADFRLYQNYPNPFNSMTKIRYDIPQVGSRKSLFVEVKVYDLLGNEIAELVNEEKTAGSYEVLFHSDKLSSGIYIYRIKTLGYQRYKKMILIK